MIFILDNIRSIHNVGAIFRTADALGATKIYICGYTPTPIDRFGRYRNDMHKVALGSEKTVKWKQYKTTKEAIEKCKDDHEILALETDGKNKVAYNKHKPKKDIAIVIGNEVDGLEKDILEMCDQVVYIPMKGKKESLNVSVAAGVAAFHFRDCN